MSLKRYLPLYCCLPKYQFDIGRMRGEVDSLSGHWAGVRESNQELSSAHCELIDKLYSHYEEIGLTVYNSSVPYAFSHNKAKGCSAIFKRGKKGQLSKHREYKVKSSNRFDDPRLDERNYSKITSLYKDTYIRRCVESVEGEPTRVRLAKLKPKEEVSWHIDYDPSYAIRLVVPIYTNSGVFNLFKQGGRVHQVHMPDNGAAWFLNTGFPHKVVNNGVTDRILLLFSLVNCKGLIDYIRGFF